MILMMSAGEQQDENSPFWDGKRDHLNSVRMFDAALHAGAINKLDISVVVSQ